MIKEIRILIIMLCLGALALGSCAEHSIEPEAEQPELISFAPMSEAAQAKASTPLPNLYPDYDFGVWGIARESLNSPYILWEENTLTRVTPRTGNPSTGNTSTSYIPEKDAYWFKGYTYNFIAIAPYNDNGFTLPTNGIVKKEDQGNTTNPKIDYITFSYDLSGKYTSSNYTFDLLAAAEQTTISDADYSTSQTLTFSHLFSQIEITNISFGTDATGTQILGSVDKIRLKAYPKGQYTISYNNNSDNRTKPTGIACDAITPETDNTAVKKEAVFSNPVFGSASTPNPKVNIIPQEVANLELYIDFKINEGTANEPSFVEYENFKINLTQPLTEYLPNGKYNWSITIGAKNAISFDVKVK